RSADWIRRGCGVSVACAAWQRVSTETARGTSERLEKGDVKIGHLRCGELSRWSVLSNDRLRRSDHANMSLRHPESSGQNQFREYSAGTFTPSSPEQRTRNGTQRPPRLRLRAIS